ncbi:MAG: hypothetical protein QUV05_04115 [Phycisphaerae bacterium]|nr:hypothetical protein [Phycisphaerae bacterium]
MPNLVKMILVHATWPAAEVLAGTATQPASVRQEISFETQAVRLTLNGEGELPGLLDRQSGFDYADLTGVIKRAVMRVGSGAYPVTAAVADGDGVFAQTAMKIRRNNSCVRIVLVESYSRQV